MVYQAASHLGWTESQWEEWIEERLEERRKVYCSDPDELVGSYNREISSAHGYVGREILELIQNADDAGSDYSTPNKMLILLTHDALYLANTGIPFGPDGVKSLMVCDNSPKQLQETRCIGYKGLGF